MNIIPAIDMRGGNCVRLLQGDFERETHYHSDPTEIARRYQDMACRDLHLVDLDGAQSGQQLNRALVQEILSTNNFAVQLGGGIRDRDSVDFWLTAGVKRVVIGSLAVTEPKLVSSWLMEIGADQFVLALDCKLDDDGVPWLATHGWTARSTVTLWDCVEQYLDAGLQHVLCTDVQRDGAMTGPSLGLYQDFVARYPALSLQASGGVRNLADLEALRDLGIAAAITGRALLDGRITQQEVLSFQRNA